MSVCKKEIFYLNCKGECESYFIDVHPPYIQPHEILPPVFESTTWGSDPIVKSKITKGLYLKKNTYYLHLKYPIAVGSLVSLSKWSNSYFLYKRNRRREADGSYVYEVRREGSNFLPIDFEVLKEGKILIVKGFKH